jgi:ABC-type polysaccharide/polyol phosphate export permease
MEICPSREVNLSVPSQLQAYFVAAVYGFSLMFLTGLLYPIEQAHPIVHLISRIIPLTFSHEPMTDWVLHGVYGWPFAKETYWLIGQLLVGVGLVAFTHSIARKRY